MAETETPSAPEAQPRKRQNVPPGKNTQREYETIYLTLPDLTPEQLDRIKDRVKGLIEREGGRVIKFTTWGRKKLAFPVAKQNRAVFVHVAYLGGGSAVSEVERNLRNLEEVTKYQTILVSEAVLPETRPTEEDVVLEGDREDERPPREARDGEGFGDDVADVVDPDERRAGGDDEEDVPEVV